MKNSSERLSAVLSRLFDRVKSVNVALLILLLTGLGQVAHAQEARIMVIGDSISGGADEASYRMPLYQTLSAESCSVDMVGDQIYTSYSYKSPVNNPGYHFPFFDPVTHPEHSQSEHWDPALGDDTDHQAFGSITAGGLLDGINLPQFPEFDVVEPVATYVSLQQPDYILLHAGTNDMDDAVRLGANTTSAMNAAADETIVEIDGIINASFSSSQNPSQLKILLANVIANGNLSDPSLTSLKLQASAIYTQKLEAYVESKKDPRIILVDVASGYNVNTMSNDGIHPHALGERHIANAFLDVLKGTGLCVTGLPVMTGPTLGQSVTGANTTVTWNYGGSDVTDWRVTAGGEQYGDTNGYFDSGVLTNDNARSVNVTGLPTNGTNVFVTLWYKKGGIWDTTLYNFFSLSGGSGVTAPAIVNPANGTNISGSTATFTWSSNSTTALQWWFEVGTSLNTNNLYNSGRIENPSTVSATVNGLPEDGSTIYVKLSYKPTSGNWISVYQTNVSVDPGGTNPPDPEQPSVVTPADGSDITGSSAIFTWSNNSTTALQWWLEVGTSLNANNLYNSGRITNPSTLNATVNGLPEDGSTIYVKLSYKPTSGNWISVYQTNISVDPGGTNPPEPKTDPAVVTPAAGSDITGSSATFTWSNNSTTALQWWFEVGTSLNSNNLYNSGRITNPSQVSATVNGLPEDGSTIYVKLSYKSSSGAWFNVYQTNVSVDAGGTTPPDPDPTTGPSVVSPVAGSNITGSSATFTWSNNSTTASQWWFEVGTSLNSNNLYNSGRITNPSEVSATVSGFPEDGSTIYVKLSYKSSSGAWINVYQTNVSVDAGGTTPPDPEPSIGPAVVSPVAGSDIVGSSATFTWSNNSTTALQWWFEVGTTANGNSLYNSERITNPSQVSATVNGLPQNGSTIYVKLSYKSSSGEWISVYQTNRSVSAAS